MFKQSNSINNTITMENQMTLAGRLLNRQVFVDIIRYAYIILFLYAAFYKLMDFDLFIRQLNKSPIIGSYSYFFAVMVPLCEIVAACLLYFKRTRRIGLYSALFIMLCFTIYIAYLLVFAPNVPCSCGGILATMGWKDHLIFNSVFIVLAVIAIILSKKTIIN